MIIHVLTSLIISYSSSQSYGAPQKPTAPPPPDTESSPVEPPVVKKHTVRPPAPEVVPSPPVVKNEPAMIENTPTVSPVQSESSGADLAREDEKNEARLARIYKKYNAQEVSDNEWSKIVGDKAAESYSLQSGDTLWDISTKFFGNGFYWPKVWQLNDQITNPHNIRVGNSLRFSPGSTTAAPQLAVNQTADADGVQPPGIGGMASTQTESGGEQDIETIQVEEGTGFAGSSQLTIPAPTKRGSKVGQIPPSFREWKSTANKYDQNGFAVEGAHKIHKTPRLSLTSIILENPWVAEGKILEMEGDTTVASTYQNLIFSSQGNLQKGDFFTVFSDNGTIDDPVTGEHLGTEIQTRGVIEVLEAVQGAQGMFRAEVIYAGLPIRIGDHLKGGKNITQVEYSRGGAESGVSARIVNGEFGKRRVLSLHNIVYLDKGDQDGLQVGSLLNVLKNTKLRNAKSIVGFDPKPIGTLKVAHVDHHVSTAIIISEKDAIQPGDETGLVADAGATNRHLMKEDNPESGDGSDSTPPVEDEQASP